MTKWVEDGSMEAPDGHRWMKPAPAECPNCPCHTARVCEGRQWAFADRPVYEDGTPFTDPCPCERAA